MTVTATETIYAGDRVRPVSGCGGLCLSDVPCDGTPGQHRINLGVFRGEGTVLETRDIVIDYDTWDAAYAGIGKVPTRNLLVQCEAGRGWLTADLALEKVPEA